MSCSALDFCFKMLDKKGVFLRFFLNNYKLILYQKH